MAPNFIGPWFVEINSHSAFGPHRQLIPTLQWTPGLTYGEFETWDAAGVQADDMIEQLVDTLTEFYPSSYEWDNFIVYNQPTPADPAIPMIGKVLTQVGAATSTAPSKAVQATWSFKTTLGGLSKLVLLDSYASADFAKVTPAAASPEVNAVIDEFTSVANGWAGRDNGRPSFFLQIAYTMNEKLRRQYYMN